MQVLHRKLGMGRLEAAAFDFMMSALMLQWIPSAVQGIYWYNGAVNYTFFFCVLLLLVSGGIVVGRKGKETHPADDSHGTAWTASGGR